MTDKQQLIYDLSTECARFQVEHDFQRDCTLQAQMLDAFTSSVGMYKSMSDAAIDAALEKLKNV